MAGKYKYNRRKHAVIAVDVALFAVVNRRLLVLLEKTKKKELKGAFALPGALIGHDEALEEAVHRVLHEKVHMKQAFIDQLASYGDPRRDPFGRVVTVAYLALVHAQTQENHAAEGHENIRWVEASKVPKLAYDHNLILKDATRRLRAKVGYTNIAVGAIAKEFTLSELQELYEVILGHALDKRNFRKRVMQEGLVEATGERREGMATRPAALYRFRSRILQEIEA